MTAATQVDQDNLYTCYCRFTDNSNSSLLEISLTEEQRDFVREQPSQPMPRKQFEQIVSKMKSKQRAELETMLRTPWEQQLRESEREAEQALHEFETNPAVRTRVAKEIEDALKKAL